MFGSPRECKEMVIKNILIAIALIGPVITVIRICVVDLIAHTKREDKTLARVIYIVMMLSRDGAIYKRVECEISSQYLFVLNVSIYYSVNL